MLTLVEKILFVVATLVSLYYTYQGVMKIIGHISSGQGKMDWSLAYGNGLENSSSKWDCSSPFFVSGWCPAFCMDSSAGDFYLFF